jgi:REP element-mobilizing transposase RayT
MQSFEKLIPGNYYHIYNRGINGEDLFKEAKNYPFFLKRLQKYLLPVSEIYAYCLLKNHFHLLVKIKETATTEVSIPFSHFFNSYAQAINKAYGRSGGLFTTPFKRKHVTNENHLTWLIWYIHANPERHKMAADFRKWPWSSYHAILANQIGFIESSQVLRFFEGIKNFETFHTSNKKDIAELVIETNS